MEQKKRNYRDSYPVLMKLRYKALTAGSTAEGIGITLKMSSTKVWFTAEGSLVPGTSVELYMAWPALLDNHVALQLVIEGKIADGDGQTLSASIQRYRFRTRGTGARFQEMGAAVVEWPGSLAIRPEQPLLLRAHA